MELEFYWNNAWREWDGLNGGTIKTSRSRLSGFFLLSVSNFPFECRFILQFE